MKTILAGLLLASVCFGDIVDDALKAYGNKNYKTSFKLFNQLCEDGDSNGCNAIGKHYEYGNHVKINLFKASDYYKKSCDMGNKSGCEFSTEIQSTMPVCSENELYFIDDARYFDMGFFSNTDSMILADSKTVSIDRKNKTIKAWTLWISSKVGRDIFVKDLGYSYSNYGYTKNLDIFNYSNRTYERKQYSDSNCDGSIIYSHNTESKWKEIPPGSAMESVLHGLIEHYNLK